MNLVGIGILVSARRRSARVAKAGNG